MGDPGLLGSLLNDFPTVGWSWEGGRRKLSSTFCDISVSSSTALNCVSGLCIWGIGRCVFYILLLLLLNIVQGGV